MANRRMISKSISVSEKVNSLTVFSALLFTWMIAHADDFGRMPGSAAKVKALVIPMREEKVSDVESALHEIESKGLIEWYEVSGTKYVQFPGWEKHQTGLHKRTKSAFPPNPIHSVECEELPTDSEKFPEIHGQQNLTELNLTKEREIAVQQIVKAYEETFGVLRGDPSQLMTLVDYMDKGMELDLIVTAIHKSSNAGSPLRYADSILRNQLRKGILTVAQEIQSEPKTNTKSEPPIRKEWTQENLDLDPNHNVMAALRPESEW